MLAEKSTCPKTCRIFVYNPLKMGAVLAPPMPAFYHHPKTVSDIVEHSVDRVLDLIGLPQPEARRWDGPAR